MSSLTGLSFSVLAFKIHIQKGTEIVENKRDNCSRGRDISFPPPPEFQVIHSALPELGEVGVGGLCG